MWGVMTKRFIGVDIKVKQILAAKVEWTAHRGQPKMTEVPDSEFTLDADLVLLALGFVHVVHRGLVDTLGLALDERGNLSVNDYMTSEEGVFAAGDALVGASLVVRAIDAGREAAVAIDRWLRR